MSRGPKRAFANSNRPSTNGEEKEATEKLIPHDYTGTMIHDGWKPYDRYFKATHQQCRAQLLGRCKEMIEAAAKETAASGAVLNGVRERCAITVILLHH